MRRESPLDAESCQKVAWIGFLSSGFFFRTFTARLPLAHLRDSHQLAVLEKRDTQRQLRLPLLRTDGCPRPVPLALEGQMGVPDQMLGQSLSQIRWVS
jgi:hypothetical protein